MGTSTELTAGDQTSLRHYWEPEGPRECRHFLLWWYFLHLSNPVLPDIQHTHSHRRHHDTSYLRLPPWKESNHIHTANKLKNMTQHAHPNIYTAIQLFKDIQNSIEIAKIQRAVGGTISELQISCVFAMKTSKNACIIRSDTFMHTYCCVSNLSKFGAYLYAVDDNTSCT